MIRNVLAEADLHAPPADALEAPLVTCDARMTQASGHVTSVEFYGGAKPA